jgi:septum formation protein
MIDDAHPLLLGSGSPRRREMLATLGLPLLVTPVDVDETPREEEASTSYMDRIVAAKLAALAARPEAKSAGALLVADTSVILDGQILGKPTDTNDARRMLRALSGRDHEVWTRYAIATPDKPSHAARAETVVTTVRFRPLADGEIDAYAETGEGRDKAGAYAIQGIGAFAVQEIEGSASNVIGLPVCEVVLALRLLGVLGRFPLPPRS